MMKKLLMTIVAVLGMAATAMAEDVTSLYVVTAEGDTATTATVATIDYVTFANDSAYFVTTEADTLYSAPLKSIDYVVFGTATATAIKSAPTATDDNVTIATKGSELSVSGVKAGTLIAIYDANGRTVSQAKATGESTTVNAAGLKPGIYIVRAGNKAIKIVKK